MGYEGRRKKEDRKAAGWGGVTPIPLDHRGRVGRRYPCPSYASIPGCMLRRVSFLQSRNLLLWAIVDTLLPQDLPSLVPGGAGGWGGGALAREEVAASIGGDLLTSATEGPRKQIFIELPTLGPWQHRSSA